MIINDKDLDNIPLATAHSIDITEFVPSDDIEPGLYYNSAYYVEPEELGKKPYHLLRKALEATGRMAVAKIALRDREHLAALHPTNGALLMNTLHWPDEIRSVEGLKGLEGDIKINPKELEMAKALIESLADSFDPSRYKDEYREAVMKVVQAKIDGEVIPRNRGRRAKRPRLPKPRGPAEKLPDLTPLSPALSPAGRGSSLPANLGAWSPTSSRSSSRAFRANCARCRPHRQRLRSVRPSTCSKSNGMGCAACSSATPTARFTCRIAASTT